jgi:hypothetical protein
VSDTQEAVLLTVIPPGLFQVSSRVQTHT